MLAASCSSFWGREQGLRQSFRFEKEQIDEQYKLALELVAVAGPWGVYACEGPLVGMRTMKGWRGIDAAALL